MKVDNIKVKSLHVAIYYPDSQIEEVLITVHGFSGDKESSIICALGKELTKYNFCVVSFDLPNHGENISDNPISLTECIEAIKVVDDYVENQFHIKPSYFATSFGAYLLLSFMQTANKQYKKIILRAPAIKMFKVLKDIILPFNGHDIQTLNKTSINLGYEKPLWIDKNFLDALSKNDLTKIFDNKQKRFYHVLQGLKDNIVSPKDVKIFFENNCKNNYKLYEFENADHRFKNKGELEKIIQLTKKILITKK